MNKRIVVDPITRIEGYLRLDAETNSEGGAHGSSHPSTISNNRCRFSKTIHSFDPCIVCAVHVVNLRGEELMQLRVR